MAKELNLLKSDIESMFHQVKVVPEDRDVLRFLWWMDGDYAQEPATYRMTVHLFGEAKLAPMRQQTNPHLELCAAVMAARTDRQLRQELGPMRVDSIFWTDSMAVLQYIRSTERRFHTFVANRVATISEHSDISQWRHIRSNLNPADEASRGIQGSELQDGCRWIRGPAFLTLNEGDWPTTTQVIPDIATNDPEVKKAPICLATTRTEKDIDVIRTLWEQQSSWHRLLKTIAWLRRFVQWCAAGSKKSACNKGQLSAGEMEEARLTILRVMQLRHFPKEMGTQKGGKPVTNGALYRLEPYLDCNGLLRVGGRLEYAILHPEHKIPILLPRDGFITELIIRDVHSRKTGHSGREHTLALV